MRITQESLQVLQECLQERIPVIFSGDAIDIVFQTYVIQVGEDFIALANKVPPAYIGRVMKSQNYGVQSKMLRFTSPGIRSDGENIIFPLADLSLLEETRQAERFPFQSDEHVVCEMVNPVDKNTVLLKTVLDMSATGLSIRSPQPSQLFRPGVKFDEIRVIIDGEPYKKATASVVYTRKLLDLNSRLRVQVGLKFETA